MTLTRRLLLAGSAATVPALTRHATAQAWPNRAIRFISAGQAGSLSDIFVRLIQERLQQRLGQTIYIENTIGSGGMNAASLVIRTGTDGYTFFISNSATNAIGVSLYRNLSFNPQTDLVPVALMATMHNALAVKADSPFQTVEDLTRYIKANPDKAMYASAGAGTSSHLAGALFAQKIGAPMVHVPYRGTGPTVIGLLRGEILCSINNIPIFMPSVQDRSLRFLAVASRNRLAELPDVPTFAEAGIDGLEVLSWYGISAARGTDAAVIDRLSTEVTEAVRDPAVSARFREIGAEPTPMSALEYRQFSDAEVRHWAPIVQSSGATVN